MGVVNHVVKVRRRTVSVCDARIVANNVDVDTVTLDLDSEWGGLSTVVAFGDGDDQVMVSVGVEPVEIPRSLTTASGYLPVTVIGYGGDGLPRMVTAAAPHAIIIVNSGVVPDQSYPDAPDLIGQLTQAADRANKAAETAEAFKVENVEVTMLPSDSEASGSFEDKTIKLEIPKGEQGPQGEPGLQGERGDCNFATFEIENGELVANTTVNPSDISFSLNGPDLEVTIDG